MSEIPDDLRAQLGDSLNAMLDDATLQAKTDQTVAHYRHYLSHAMAAMEAHRAGNMADYVAQLQRCGDIILGLDLVDIASLAGYAVLDLAKLQLEVGDLER